jgi:hypothetical protein
MLPVNLVWVGSGFKSSSLIRMHEVARGESEEEIKQFGGPGGIDTETEALFLEELGGFGAGAAGRGRMELPQFTPLLLAWDWIWEMSTVNCSSSGRSRRPGLQFRSRSA